MIPDGYRISDFLDATHYIYGGSLYKICHLISFADVQKKVKSGATLLRKIAS